jgi:TonB family protein
MNAPRALAALLLVLAVPGATLLAQEEPLAAGSEGVPLPKKTKHVQPSYPAEALAQGVRGIVILDVVVSAQGKVETATVVRSVPGLDEAAIVAARQWEYEPVKVGGKPVRVRVTVPVVFSLALPALARQGGVPELRQGVAPAWPAGATGGGLVIAEVTLEPDGRVGVAQVLEGGAPWSNALLAALRTWRFTPPPEDEALSFRVEAEFVTARDSEPQKINLKATGLQRSSLLAESAPPPAAPAAALPTQAAAQAPPAQQPPAQQPAAQQPPAQQPPAQQPPAQQPPARQQPPPQAPPPQAPPPQAPPAQAPPVQAPQSSPAPAAAPAPGPAVASRPSARPADAPQGSGASAPPPVEVLTAPPPPLPPENGISAIRDVTLEPGVPDLTRGRRPVAPPLARMSGTTGTVEVSFSVSAAGIPSLQGSSGPEVLRAAAEQAVSSWVFRRARTDRIYLVALFTYSGDRSSAIVRPQAAAAGAPAAPAAPPPGPPGS